MSKKKRLGYTPEQIAAATKARDSASKSTPKIVVDAFLPDQVLAGNLPLQPVTMSTIIALQKVGCGLLKSENPAEFQMEDIAKALYILTNPIAEVRKAIAAKVFEISVTAMADLIPAALLPKIGETLNEYLKSAFDTAVPYGPSDKSDANSPFPPARTQDPGLAGSQP